MAVSKLSGLRELNRRRITCSAVSYKGKNTIVRTIKRLKQPSSGSNPVIAMTVSPPKKSDCLLREHYDLIATCHLVNLSRVCREPLVAN